MLTSIVKSTNPVALNERLRAKRKKEYIVMEEPPGSGA
jgi:hypothetical protein